MPVPVDLKAIREARLAEFKASRDKLAGNVQKQEIITEVTEAEVRNLLKEAENLDWENISVFSMLAWAEQAVDVFQRMTGEPQCTIIGNKRT